jgi:hypothetical protein
VKQNIDQLLQTMPEERLYEVLSFAQFLSWRDEEDSWRRFGQRQFAKAYGPNEPDYSATDLKLDLTHEPRR